MEDPLLSVKLDRSPGNYSGTPAGAADFYGAASGLRYALPVRAAAKAKRNGSGLMHFAEPRSQLPTEFSLRVLEALARASRWLMAAPVRRLDTHIPSRSEIECFGPDLVGIEFVNQQGRTDGSGCRCERGPVTRNRRPGCAVP